MSNLQFLSFRGYGGNTLQVSRALNYLSRKLRLLHWSRFPMTCLPSTVNLEFLVELIMCESKLEKLWEGVKPLPSLKWMYLSRSVNLKELPDLSTATNLEELNLHDCSSLIKLPSFDRNATRIKILDMGGCSSLVEFPSFIGNAVYKTGGGPLTIKLNERPLTTSMRFKACILLVYKGDDDACYKENSTEVDLTYGNGMYGHAIFSPLPEHLYIFTVKPDVISSEHLFEFKLESDNMWEIGEWGIVQLSEPLPTSMRFKACILLVYKGDDEDDACYKDNSTGLNVMYRKGMYAHTIYSPLPEHLYIFTVKPDVTSSELLFEFKLESDDMWEIGDWGIVQLSEAPYEDALAKWFATRS
ncbi:unnamed protein product [Thlaspi arvense]|uniref:Uncharacterized protein n=1 Tax=Thlaspi arvense TaxID=13288 RepID=A0AAU9SUM4_THLAR|nr:unnamed protein product [Thlaspi arvense]